LKVKIHLSVVSHGQAQMVSLLLDDLKMVAMANDIVVTLTLNIPEVLPFDPETFPFLIRVEKNTIPKGFGANHNAAFYKHQNDSIYFCVVNPDIRLNQDPFLTLLTCLKNDGVGVAAPMVVDENGLQEDSARLFPTPFKIICKVFGGGKGCDYENKNEPIYPDWVGGMFMLFPRKIFEKLNGFNERFFLYYEDVDLCARLRLLGYEVVMCPAAKVVHLARRSSHSSFRYLKWHLTSMLRFFCSVVFLQIIWRKLSRVNIK
jgi:N-acetylglucosaminyl-diphospho-decaprenol L-rhamnosyltransferase